MKHIYRLAHQPAKPKARRYGSPLWSASASSALDSDDRALQNVQRGAGNTVMRNTAKAAEVGELRDRAPSPAALYQSAYLALQPRLEAQEPSWPGAASSYDSLIAIANGLSARPEVEKPSLAATGRAPVQAMLEDSKSNDEYELEADQMAETVMQMPAAVLAEKWLEERPTAQRLVESIDPDDEPAQILQALMLRFRALGQDFTYNPLLSVGADKFLKGEKMDGDCQTLARAFKLIGEDYYNIQGITVDHCKIHLSEAPRTPYSGSKPNCDNRQRWLFQNHYWVVWGGTKYDLLFCETDPQFASVDGTEHSSIMFPNGKYVRLEDQRIAYQMPDGKWATIPMGMSDQLYYVMANGSTVLVNVLSRALQRGIGYLIWPLKWAIEQIRNRVGGQQQSDFHVLGELRNREPSDVPDGPNERAGRRL